MCSRRTFVLAVFLIGIFTPAIRADSTGMLFDLSEVRTYDLTFYSQDYEQQLTANYETSEYLPARFTCGDIVLDSVGVRYKGNSSYSSTRNKPKKPYKIKFDKYREQTFFGVKKLNFSNCFKDPSFMREVIGYRAAAYYLHSPRANYVNLSVNGEKVGLYVQVEQVDKTFLNRFFEDNDFNLYKAGDGGTGLEYQGSDVGSYDDEIELKTNEDENDWSRLIALLEKLENCPAGDFIDTVGAMLDFDMAMRHLAFTMVLSHFDSYTGSGRNFYLYDDQTTGKFVIMPWDLNETFGSYSNSWDVVTAHITDIPNLNSRPLNGRILENDSLTQCYLGIIADMLAGPFSGDSIAAWCAQIQPIIDAHVASDENALYGYDKFLENIEDDVSTSSGSRGGGTPGIKSFIRERAAALYSQLELLGYNVPVVEPAGRETPAGGSLKVYRGSGKKSACIEYSLESSSPVTIAVFSSSGRRMVRLNLGLRLAGNHRFFLNRTDIAPGCYAVELRAGKHRENIFFSIID